MPFVFDASAILACLLPDESSVSGDRLLAAIATEGALVPAVFWLELANTLVVAERRGRLAPSEGDALLRRMVESNITTDRLADPLNVLSLARQYELTAYDAAYLELALRLASPLASLDDRLLLAIDAAGGTRYSTS
jgi:predicted nucleic acid-binding protein